MSTSQRPVCHSLLQAIGRTTLATPLAICLLLTGVSRASDKATVADATNANESATPQRSAADSHALYDTIRKLFARPPQLSPEELYECVAPSVVTIHARDENHEPTVTGSGFFIDDSLFHDRNGPPEIEGGYERNLRRDKDIQGAIVLTNYHVIRPAAFANIVLSNGDSGVVWHVIAEDEKLDLAILAVSVPSHVEVNVIPLALNDPRVMTTVYAIGSPEGLSGTASEGKVSAYREIYGGDHWLQTTAPVSPGSSGGPLLLADGTLSGVTTLTHKEGQNLNFAIPVSAIRTFMSQGQFRRRDTVVGASVHWHELWAFTEMNVEAKSKEYSDADRNAVAILLEAWRGLLDGPGEDGDSLTHYEKIIASAQGTEELLPDDFKYLLNFVVGKASLCAATQAEPSAKDGARTEESCIRYRENRYAADAHDHLVKAAELKPDFSPAYQQLCHHRRLSGNWADALLAGDKLVTLLPRSGEARALRAECYRELGQPDSAKSDLEAAIELSPANGKLHYQLADVLIDLGDYDDAIKSYQRALACDAPQHRDKVHYHLGLAYRKAGNVEKALAEFTTAKALGWSADVCDSQLAECQLLKVHPAALPHRHAQAVQTKQTALHPQQSTVYVTKTGKRYHRDGCAYLSKSMIPMPLNDAVAMYEPCSHCHPPTLDTTNPDSVSVAVSKYPNPRD